MNLKLFIPEFTLAGFAILVIVLDLVLRQKLVLRWITLVGLVAARPDRRTRKWVDIKLLYIGKAFNQTIRKRLPQDHSAFDCIEEFFEDEDNQDMDLVVMIGTLVSSTLQRVTKQLFDDIEACLIFRNLPLNALW